MNDQQQSLQRLRSSASGAALVRAYAAMEPDPAIRNPDYLAREFLDADMRPSADTPDKVKTFRDELERILPGAYHFQNSRTKHIDARILAAINGGFRQVVLLGAGFDSRAYRLGEKYPEVRFFEVDRPELQADKVKRVSAMLGDIPSQVRFVPLDFNNQPLSDILDAPGYNPDEPTYYNWEGVSYYLTAAGVDATLAFIASQCRGSRVLFDYMPEAMVDGTGDYYGGAESRRHMGGMGEPLIFGIEDGTIAGFLASRGFNVLENLDNEALAERYLRLSDGNLHGRVSGYVRIVEAEVG